MATPRDMIGIPTEDTSMNGSNGSPIIVEHPKDRIGPTEDAKWIPASYFSDQDALQADMQANRIPEEK